MFGIGSKPKIERQELKALLARCVLDPDKAWIPVSPVPKAGGPDLPKWNRQFPKVSDNPNLPARAEVEQLVSAYMRMGFWDFAFAIVTYAYVGELRMREMTRFVWDGPPGVSRIWLQREDMLLPLPKTGPIRQAAETWWLLSGGYMNHTQQFLPIYEDEFYAQFRSLNSPIILTMPFGSDDPDYVLSELKGCFRNEMAYPLAYRNNRASIASANPEVSGDGPALRYRGWPVDWATHVQEAKDSFLTMPWGIKWLEKAKASIPDRIYQRALTFRKNRFAKTGAYFD
jgi:hypothetical protein